MIWYMVLTEGKEIRNIIFDLGGVIVPLRPERCIEAFHFIGAGKIARYVEEHRVEDLFLDAEIGNIDSHEFCNRVRELVGKDIPDDKIVWAWNELLGNVPQSKLERLLLLRRKYNVYLLSNTNDMHWDKCENVLLGHEGHGLHELFNDVFISYRLHLAKPDTEIFRRVVGMAGITPDETLFIDDSKVNCDAATKVGIHSLWNKDDDYWLSCGLS